MKRAGVVVFAGFVAFAAVAHADAEMMRTFVNGIGSAEGTVRDLHIEYTQPLDSGTVVGDGGTGTIGTNPKHLDVNFNAAVGPAGAVSIRAHTMSGSLAIEKFWWTDAAHKPITRTVTYVDDKNNPTTGKITEYLPWMRGDEARLPDPLPRDTEDPYVILNKRHHWGGDARTTREVCIEMDITNILRAPPAGVTAAAVEANIRASVKQWTTCTMLSQQRDAPPRADPDNPNHGDNNKWIDPPVMAPGPSHGDAKGQKFRSVTDRECMAALLKYPCGLRIEIKKAVSDKGCRAPVTTAAECVGGRQATSDGSIPVGWGGTPGTAVGYGPSDAKKDDPNATGTAGIGMDKTPKDKGWSMPTDTNGDGWITNTDGPIDAETYDFYSVFNHELGHVICFSHAGSAYFLDEHAQLIAPSPIELPGSAVAVCGTAAGDPGAKEHESILFAAALEGGLGGLDIWRAIPVDRKWEVVNLGPNVNSPKDDTDPFLASDGTTLMFTSNRGGAGHTMFEVVFDVATEQWRAAEPLVISLEHPGSEHHPALTADMRTLYFASDEVGGATGSDIWASEWIERAWSPPFRLGDAINTPANEIDPSISGDGRALYFASDRPGGAGGYDLWRSSLGSGWQPPIPITIANTKADERAPSLRLDGEILYYTSGTDDAARRVFAAMRADPPAPIPTPPQGSASSPPAPSSASGSNLRWIALAIVAVLAIVLAIVTVRRKKRE